MEKVIFSADVSARLTSTDQPWDLNCTRQGSNLQPYDPKSYSTRLASCKVRTNQELPDKITLESRASRIGRIGFRGTTIAEDSPGPNLFTNTPKKFSDTLTGRGSPVTRTAPLIR